MRADYEYRPSEETNTIEDYIDSRSADSISYYTTSFLDRINNIKYSSYNVVFDYIDELRDEYSVDVSLSDKELEKYKYRPKLLCYDIYDNTELAFIILLINDMYSAKQFVKKDIKLPTIDQMNNIISFITNSNRKDINIYNKKYALQ